MSAAKVKGSNFERQIASRLSERFAEKTGLDQAFRRATDSGAYYGRSNAKRLLSTGSEHATFGDILCPRNFRFTVECKRYQKAPSLASLAKHSNQQLDGWLEQANADAANAGKISCLIVKWDHCPTLVFIPAAFNVDQWMTYQSRSVLTLDQWLDLTDNHFFGEVAR